MSGVPVGAARRLRLGLLGLVAVAAMLAASIDQADARKRKRGAAKRYHHAQTHSYSPRYASIVVDAKTGATLQQSNADSLRHPASLTKVMTLYLLFERLEAGRIRLDTRMHVSEQAASAAPTKLGVRPGQTLSVEDAIKGLVTKSANDAAVVLAETLAGSEEEFAALMTRKARALGMSRTIYRNASGLPDDEQVTTAREQALLAMAIQERFPRYYRYFSIPAFSYNGKAMRNHNKLLGRVAGVDGIKTGYTRASGFNLMTSMRRADRHIVAVVLGGASAGARDARMRSLVEEHIMEASIRRTTTKFAEAPEQTVAPAQAPVAATAFAPAETPARPKLASAASVPVAAPAPVAAVAVPAPVDATAAIPTPRLGSTEPIKPVPVKTVMVKMASAKAIPAPAPAPVVKPAPVQTAAIAPVAVPQPSVAAPPPQIAAPQVQPAPMPQPVEATAPPPPPPGARPGVLGVLPASMAAVGNAVVPAAAAAERKPPLRSGWVVQIGAYEDEAEAKQRLSAARSKAGKALGRADPYTERTSKGAKTYYRARFAGFERDEAEAVCKQLKRNDITCMALKI